VDQSTGIERIRTATFTLERRGYDKREVEKFLNQIADWLETGGGDQARSDVVRRELERVGQRTAGILATAEDAAEEIRADADEYSAKTRAAADAYAGQARREADEDAAGTREEAERDARDRLADAEAKATRIVEEGSARRRDIEAVITDLVARRDGVIAEANRLADELRQAADAHMPARGEDRFAEPSELDPSERVGA
jgi:DivIVA domain-containing protein